MITERQPSPAGIRRLSGRRRKRETPVLAGGSRLCALSCLALWLLATGTHWNALQVFAWTKMTVDNSSTLSFGEAVARTFAADGACDLCLVVQSVKAQQEEEPETEVTAAAEKLLLAFVRSPACILPVPVGESFPWTDSARRELLRDSPPHPPPRTA